MPINLGFLLQMLNNFWNSKLVLCFSQSSCNLMPDFGNLSLLVLTNMNVLRMYKLYTVDSLYLTNIVWIQSCPFDNFNSLLSILILFKFSSSCPVINLKVLFLLIEKCKLPFVFPPLIHYMGYRLVNESRITKKIIGKKIDGLCFLQFLNYYLCQIKIKHWVVICVEPTKIIQTLLYQYRFICALQTPDSYVL